MAKVYNDAVWSKKETLLPQTKSFSVSKDICNWFVALRSRIMKLSLITNINIIYSRIPRINYLSFFIIISAAVIPPVGQAAAKIPQSQCSGGGTGQAGGGSASTKYYPDTPTPALAAAGSSIPQYAGGVDPKSGGFIFENEDIAVGNGSFPARLSLVRTYRSDRDSYSLQNNAPPMPAVPGSPTWFPFGRGSTHSLDIRYDVSHERLGGELFETVYISRGFKTAVFQKCSNGQYVNLAKDGSRLIPDATYGSAFRYELPDGTKIYLIQQTHSNVCVLTIFDFPCGIASRLVYPNGDWVQLEYQNYYSHVDKYFNQAHDYRIMGWDGSQNICHVNYLNQNECHQVYAPFYLVDESNYGYKDNQPVYANRLISATNSRGYRLEFSYVDSTVDPGSYCVLSAHQDGGAPNYSCLPPRNSGMERNRISGIKAYSLDAVGNKTLLRQVSYTYMVKPYSLSISPDYVHEFEDASGAVTKFEWTADSLAIFSPADHVNPMTTISFVRETDGHFYYLPVDFYGSGFTTMGYTKYDRVANQVFAGGESRQYSPVTGIEWRQDWALLWAPKPIVTQMTVTDGASGQMQYVYGNENLPVEITDQLGRTTFNNYSATDALLSTTDPAGITTSFEYDVRGNLTKKATIPKSGSGLPSTIETFTFVGGPTLEANSCANQLTCNRPLAATDAKGNSTTFTWDAASGMLASRTDPADSTGVHPVESFTYANFGGYGGATIRLPVSQTTKVSSTEATTTTYGYEASTRRLPREVAQTSGGTTLRSCLKFDAYGDPISVTQPNANLSVCP